MSQLSSSTLASPARQSQAVNPFARALADAEREKQGGAPISSTISHDNTNLFSDALARSGDSLADPNASQGNWAAEQQRQAEQAQKKEALRRRLHDQINPVDAVDIFSAREQQVKKEIDQLRQELKMLVTEVAEFNQEVELTLMTEVSSPGEGKYFLTFFQRLRSFIMLLRQKISSAKTWATQLQGKSAKRKQRNGMVIGGMQHEKTSTIQDMMHHERSSQYSGG